MRKDKGSLVFPSNPLARLQELRAEFDYTSNETSFIEDVKEGSDTTKVITRIANTSPKEPTSRLNVELRDSLHTRLKTYCAKRKIPIRVVVDALIEDFLNHSESTP